MNLKQSLLLTGLFLISYGNIFSQSVPCEKQEFVYKTVKGHNIKANIFLPASKEKLPVLVYFHGGGFIFGNRDRGQHPEVIDKIIDFLNIINY